MSTELIINASLPETRIALMENGEIQDIVVERASGKGIAGNIYKGRVTRVLPGMQAAFVDIGLEKAAFLYVDDVFVRSEIWERQEDEGEEGEEEASQEAPPATSDAPEAPQEIAQELAPDEGAQTIPSEPSEQDAMDHLADEFDADEDDEEVDGDNGEDDDRGPVSMGPPPEGDEEDQGGDEDGDGDEDDDSGPSSEEAIAPEGQEAGAEQGAQVEGAQQDPQARRRGRRSRRGRRGGRNRKRGERPSGQTEAAAQQGEIPETFHEQLAEQGSLDSDRSQLSAVDAPVDGASNRPETPNRETPAADRGPVSRERPEFREQRGRDRRIRGRQARAPRAPVNIQDLLKEGQEVLVQVAKDPIATKGARLTCHISLPGRHLVCMPTIDHVGVSRRIERDDERRKLRDLVERHRPKNVGFIVRTASGRGQSEKRVKQDIDYLTRLWTEIREKAAAVTAPAMVYEDLNPVLRAIRDWVTEDIDKIVVDSRYHYNEILRFVSHFMPVLRQKVELYHGDIPIFDAYNISTELSRALERKVWLKSGGYLVIDQAEALVAIDVNTGRYVGKKNLEDTILKTNLEAVQEIAYQLRLRNAGGIIILDLIDMEKEENKQRVYRALEEAIKRDRARPSILKISELGLIEMTRKRTRDTMVRALCESCPACEGRGFVKSKQTVAYEVMREIEREGVEREISKVLVQAHPDVIDILAIDERETLDHLERRYRKQIFLQAVADYHQEQFEVVGDKKPRAEIGRDRDRGRDSRRDRGRDSRRDRQQQGRQNQQQLQTPRPLTVPKPLSVITSSVSQAPTIVAVSVEPGNSVESAPNGVELASPQMPSEGSEQAQPQLSRQLQPRQPQDDDFSEEDRLAFLRAQAAQDAALAQLRASDPLGRASRGAPKGDRSGDSGGGKRGRNRRGRRGSPGGRGPKQRWGAKKDQGGAVSADSSPSGGGEPAGGNDSGGDGGGGDHSQPPV